MARPKKYNADYFPHNNDMRNDRRCKALRSKFNLEGYAVFVMLLEALTGANHFQIENNKMELELIAGDIDIDSKKLNAILEYLIKIGLLVQEGDLISSPMLNDLKSILNDLREKDRGRKTNPTENATKDNATKDNSVFQSENPVIQSENAQSKVKESKVNKRKENEMKEKGKEENHPPIILNNFSKKEKTENPLSENQNSEKLLPKEKSSVQKENIADGALPLCKQLFEKFAPLYVWEAKDREQLVMLLQKICITKPNLANENELAEAFQSFIQKLPEYWRTKKFTIPNLNFNYNEIVSEIRAKNISIKEKKQTARQPLVHKQHEIKREPTAEEKQTIKNNFIHSICETFQNFVLTGEYGFMPLWVMHDTLVAENILKLSEKKLALYRKQAIEARKEELHKPKHPSEARAFSAILENFSQQIESTDEKNRIEMTVKNLSVQGLFEALKKSKTDIKKLFNQ
jgi:hypothetical protein